MNSDTGTRGQLNPAIAVDGSNNAYAVWQDDRDGTNNHIDTNIYFSKRAAGTGLWGTNLKVNDDTQQNPVQRNPRIAVTSAGAASAVWVDLRASQINIYGSTLAAGGSVWAANKRVSDNTAATKDAPDVVVGADGTSYAVWQDSRNGNADIYFSKLTAGGAAWSANVKVSDDPGTAAQTAPRIGIDSAGNLTVIWLDARTSPVQLRVSRQTAGSNIWSASTQVTDAAARPTGIPALSERPDGSAWVAWSDTRGSSTDIWGARYSSGAWSTSQLLSDDPGAAAQANPTLAYSTAELAMAWRDDRSGNADIRASRIQYNPGVDHFGYSYDGLERLTAGTTTNPESFTLDAGSNIASRTGPTATYSYDTANRLTSDGTQAFTWNNADRLATRGVDTFGYDPLDRMTSSTVAGTARTYTYNGDGLLQSRTQGASTTQFLWDPSSSPSRLLLQGSDKLVYGLGPLWVVKADGTTSSFARDGGKSVRAEVNGAGTVTASFRYRAYGAIAQSNGASAPTYLGYAGQLQDPSGLLYMRARWYDPSAGRFTTRDAAGGSADMPATLNLFNYSGLNPLLLSDPSGMAATANEPGGCDETCDSSGQTTVTVPNPPAPPQQTCGLCDWVGGAVKSALVGSDATVTDTGGLRVIANARGGIYGWIVSWGGDDNTITFGSDLIVSRVAALDPTGPTMRHEMGHVAQASELGLGYLPTYIVEYFVVAPMVQDEFSKRGYSISFHDAHPMELDANYRAGLTVAPTLRRQ